MKMQVSWNYKPDNFYEIKRWSLGLAASSRFAGAKQTDKSTTEKQTSEEQAALDEMVQALKNAANLDAQDRQIILLRFRDDLLFDEIGQQLKLTEQDVIERLRQVVPHYPAVRKFWDIKTHRPVEQKAAKVQPKKIKPELPINTPSLTVDSVFDGLTDKQIIDIVSNERGLTAKDLSRLKKYSKIQTLLHRLQVRQNLHQLNNEEYFAYIIEEARQYFNKRLKRDWAIEPFLHNPRPSKAYTVDANMQHIHTIKEHLLSAARRLTEAIVGRYIGISVLTFNDQQLAFLERIAKQYDTTRNINFAEVANAVGTTRHIVRKNTDKLLASIGLASVPYLETPQQAYVVALKQLGLSYAVVEAKTGMTKANIYRDCRRFGEDLIGERRIETRKTPAPQQFPPPTAAEKLQKLHDTAPSQYKVYDTVGWLLKLLERQKGNRYSGIVGQAISLAASSLHQTRSSVSNAYYQAKAQLNGVKPRGNYNPFRLEAIPPIALELSTDKSPANLWARRDYLTDRERLAFATMTYYHEPGQNFSLLAEKAGMNTSNFNIAYHDACHKLYIDRVILKSRLEADKLSMPPELQALGITDEKWKTTPLTGAQRQHLKNYIWAARTAGGNDRRIAEQMKTISRDRLTDTIGAACKRLGIKAKDLRNLFKNKS